MRGNTFNRLIWLSIVGCLAVESAYGAIAQDIIDTQERDLETWNSIYQEIFIDSMIALKPHEVIERLKRLEKICARQETKECLIRRNRVDYLLPLSDITTFRCEKQPFLEIDSMIRKESTSRNVIQYLITAREIHGLACAPIFEEKMKQSLDKFSPAERDVLAFLKEKDESPHSSLPIGIVQTLQSQSEDLNANNFAEKFNAIKKLCVRVQREFKDLIDALDLIMKDSFVLKNIDDSTTDTIDDLKICDSIMKNPERTFSESFEILNNELFEKELKSGS